MGKSIPATKAPKYPKSPRLLKTLSKALKYVRAIATRMDAPSRVRLGYLTRNFIYYLSIVSAPFKQAKSHPLKGWLFATELFPKTPEGLGRFPMREPTTPRSRSSEPSRKRWLYSLAFWGKV